jgi:cytochrome c peroxidase
MATMMMLLSAALSLLGCSSEQPKGTAATATASASGSAAGQTPTAPGAAKLPVYEGSAVVRDLSSRFLVVADEDHKQLRVVDLPLSAESKPRNLEMPGPPAQALMLAGRLLVTIRNPSLLIALELGNGTDPAAWKEAFRTELPNDAWGLAVDTDSKTAFVSSAWGRRVSAVSLSDGEKRWSVPVAREPRGLLVRGDTLFVNHLVGADITRITGLGSDKPEVARRELWPAPLRTPVGIEPGAALGYALVASPDGRRLFVPRHAIGVLGEWSWYGATTIDAFNIPLDEAVLEKPKYRRATDMSEFDNGDNDHWKFISRSPPAVVVEGGPVAMTATMARQPRHAVYRESTNTLLVASEGLNQIVEFDALVPAPGISPTFVYDLGYEEKAVLQYPTRSGAPTGIVLSHDEATAYVYCRSTDDLVAQKLRTEEYERSPGEKPRSSKLGKPIVVRLVDESAHADPSDKRVELLQVGRAAFYQAKSDKIGQGAACATCHPDGRDDGHVWLESHESNNKGEQVRLVANLRLTEARLLGGWRKKKAEITEKVARPRQTPMLAGRVSHAGPFGWRGESEKLEDRVIAGMILHRSIESNDYYESTGPTRNYVGAGIARFLREGLRPPARDDRPLSDLEQKGRALFMSPAVRCSSCHAPKTHYTDGTGYPKIVSNKDGYVDESKKTFRTPPLAFVGGTEPYLHDGSRPTLESLIRLNNDKMGKTNHLTDEERKALVAFLRTL